MVNRRSVSSAPPTLTAAERADDLNVIAGAQWGREPSRLLIVDKNPDVLPNRVLLRDDAKAQTGTLPVECGERLSQRNAVHLDFTAVGGIRAEWRGDGNSHHLKTPIILHTRRRIVHIRRRAFRAKHTGGERVQCSIASTE